MNATIKAMIEGLNCPETNPGIDQKIREAIILGDSRTLEKTKEQCVAFQTAATRAYNVVSDAMKRVNAAMESEISLFVEEDLQDLNGALNRIWDVCEWYAQRVALISKYL